jgi:hypothetical protein
MTTRARRTVTIFLAATLLASVAPAQSHEIEADQHFTRGVSALKRGEVDGAVLEFEAAYQASPRFEVLFNLGQAYGLTGRLVEAWETLRRYLEDAGDRIDPTRREQVETTVKLYERLTASVMVDTPEPGTVVTIDGRPIQTGRSVRLLAGTHALVATRPGCATLVRTLELKPGVETKIALTLEPERALVPNSDTRLGPAKRPERIPHHADLPQPSPVGQRRSWALASASGGLAFGILAGGLAYMATREARDWRRDRAALSRDLTTGGVTPQELDRASGLNQRAAAIQRLDDMTVAAAIVGGALFTISINFWVFGDKEASETRKRTAARGSR